MKSNLDDLQRIIATYPTNHPAYIVALQQMIDSLPQEEQERLKKEAMDILGNPCPDGYDVDGKPVYTAETMARCSGIPLDEIEKHCKEYNQLFGPIELDEKVKVLKQSEYEYKITPEGVVKLALHEWTDSNDKVMPLLNQWFELAVNRGLKPIVIEQLKQVINQPGWDMNMAERYLKRIYQYATVEEFVIDIMGIKPV